MGLVLLLFGRERAKAHCGIEVVVGFEVYFFLCFFFAEHEMSFFFCSDLLMNGLVFFSIRMFFLFYK